MLHVVLGFLSKGVSGKKNVRFMNQNIKIQLISVLVVGIIIGLGVYPFIFPTYYDEGDESRVRRISGK